jgi:hypothetical protein
MVAAAMAATSADQHPKRRRGQGSAVSTADIRPQSYKNEFK